MMQTIVITGGTGMIGTILTKHLVNAGNKVVIYTRQPGKHRKTENISYASWDIHTREIDKKPLQEANYIIHLAGAGVMDKAWTHAYKKEIVDSRVNSSRLIIDTLKNISHHVKAIISASAIGYYGENNGALPFTENAPAADDFLAHTCELWEKSVAEANKIGIRTVMIRTGIVLANEGGAFASFKKGLPFGIAGIPGNGSQVCSWIHIDDLCRLYMHAMDNETMNGPYNGVAPTPVTLNKLITTLAEKKNGKAFLPIHAPSFLIKLILGERSDEILKSTHVSSEKPEESGFVFTYPGIDKCIEDLVQRNS